MKKQRGAGKASAPLDFSIAPPVKATYRYGDIYECSIVYCWDYGSSKKRYILGCSKKQSGHFDDMVHEIVKDANDGRLKTKSEAKAALDRMISANQEEDVEMD